MRLLICGCVYGAGNIGDEAILEGLLKLLPKDHEIALCVTAHPEAYQRRRLKTFGHAKPAVLRAVAWADMVILGGGSLLTDPAGPGYPINNCGFILHTARALGRPAVFIGIGATHLNHAESLRIARATYPHARRFFVRNEESKEAIVHQLGIAPERVFAIADPAFLLAGRADKPRGRCLLLDHGIALPGDRRLVGISIVNEGFEKGRDYHRQIARACDALWTHHACEIVFVHSEVRQGSRYDRAAAAAVKKAMTCPSQELPPVFHDPIDFASMLANFDCVIAMRMHVVILAALSGVPAFPIVREEKVTQVLHDLHIDRFTDIDSITSEQVVRGVTACLANRQVIGRRLLERVNSLAQRCRDTFDKNMVWEDGDRPTFLDRLRSQWGVFNAVMRAIRMRLLRSMHPAS